MQEKNITPKFVKKLPNTVSCTSIGRTKSNALIHIKIKAIKTMVAMDLGMSKI